MAKVAVAVSDNKSPSEAGTRDDGDDRLLELKPVTFTVSFDEVLRVALDAFFRAADCAPSTKVAYRENSCALVRKFGDRPIGEFAGRRGGRLVTSYLLSETGPRRRRPPVVSEAHLRREPCVLVWALFERRSSSC